MSDVVIYSKDNCTYCYQAKSWLKKHNISFDEIKLNDDQKRLEFYESYQDVRTMPQIFYKGKRIGGYQELIQSGLEDLIRVSKFDSEF